MKLSVDEARQIRRNFQAVAVATIALLIIGVIMMRYLEGLSTLDALYFSVISLTTVGYGDFTPETAGGKIFVMGYLVIGIALMGVVINLLLKNFAAKRTIKELEDEISAQKK